MIDEEVSFKCGYIRSYSRVMLYKSEAVVVLEKLEEMQPRLNKISFLLLG